MGERISGVERLQEHQETFVGDKDADYLHCDDDFMGIYIRQNFFVYTLNKVYVTIP